MVIEWRSESSMAPSVSSPPWMWATGMLNGRSGQGRRVHLEAVAEHDHDVGAPVGEDVGEPDDSPADRLGRASGVVG